MAYTFGSVFSDAWGFYKKNIKNLLLFTAIIFILSALMQYFLFTSFMNEYPKMVSDFSIEAEQMTGVSDDAGIGLFFVRMFNLYLRIAMLWMIVCMLVFLAIQAVVIYSTRSKGKLSEILSKGLSYYGKLFLLEIFRGLCLLALLILPIFFFWLAFFLNMPWIIIIGVLMFIPLCIFAMNWYFADFCLILGNSKVLDCLKDSSKLVRGRWWKTLGYMVLVSLIVGGIGFAVNIVIGAFFPSQNFNVDAMNNVNVTIDLSAQQTNPPIIQLMNLNKTNYAIQLILNNAVSSLTGIFLLIFFAHLFFAMKANPVVAEKAANSISESAAIAKKATAPAKKKKNR